MSTTTVAAAPEARGSALQRLAVLHPLTAYFTIAFAAFWLVMLPIVLSVDGLALLPLRVPEPVWVVLFMIGTFAGPTGAAFFVTHALEGRAGMRRLLRRYGQWRVGILPWLIVLFAYPLIYLAVGTIQYGAGPLQALAAQPLTFFTAYLPALLIFPAILQWGEEPGWRGFALTRMQTGYGPLIAALVVGLMHGLWHLPLFLLKSGPVALGPWDLVAFGSNTLLAMLVSVVWTWVFNRAGGSILIAVFLHASQNAVGNWLNAFAPILNQEANSILSYGFIVLLALLAVVATRGKLGYEAPANM